MPDPMYAATDWMAAYDRLRAQGMMQPETTQLRAGGMPPWWWDEQRYRESRTPGLIPQPQDVQAIPLGDLADPVSQVAFLLSPHLLAGMQALAAQTAQPGMSLRGLGAYGGRGRPGMFLQSERGNLGPPPVNAQGEVLPESVVRGPQGQLQRLYHGTPSKYADFSMEHMDPQGLYGPGVYMTESADIAGGSPAEVARGYMGYASKGYQPDTPQWVAQLRDGWRDQLHQRQAALAKLEQEARLPGRPAARDAQRLQRMRYDVEEAQLQLEGAERDLVQSLSEGPHIRPVYADLKRPFDMEGSLSKAQAQTLLEAVGYSEPSIVRFTGRYGRRGIPSKDVYQQMSYQAGEKQGANQALQEAGYDGITHMGGAVTGGQPHRVYIAFSPEQVYPSFGVDALMQQGGR